MTEVRVEVRHAGLLTTVQDAGRHRVAFYGLPRCGWLDPEAARLANRLAGNPDDAPLLECNLMPPRLRFSDDLRLTLTGADMDWQLDGTPLPRNRLHSAAAGSELAGAAASNGARAYIAFAGALQCNRAHGSASTDLASELGGIEGRPLAAGDVLTVDPAAVDPAPGAVAATETPPVEDYERIEVIRCRRGPEWTLLPAEARHALPRATFSVSAESNRMGARLGGPRLLVPASGEMASVPVVPGVVQLTSSGRLIVLLRDGQTTGGYPRIVVIPEAELGRFSQIRPGRRFRFQLGPVHRP